MSKEVGQTSTRIAPDTVVHGTVETPGDLFIEGRVEGEIRCGGVIDVAPGGTCMAEVVARRAVIRGEVLGRTACHEAIEVAAGGRVVGDLRAPDIAVDGRATVEGRVDLLPPDPDQTTVRPWPLAAAPGPDLRPAPSPPAAPRPGQPAAAAAGAPEFPDLSAGEARGSASDATTGRETHTIPRPPRPRGRVSLGNRAPSS